MLYRCKCTRPDPNDASAFAFCSSASAGLHVCTMLASRTCSPCGHISCSAHWCERLRPKPLRSGNNGSHGPTALPGEGLALAHRASLTRASRAMAMTDRLVRWARLRRHHVRPRERFRDDIAHRPRLGHLRVSLLHSAQPHREDNELETSSDRPPIDPNSTPN